MVIGTPDGPLWGAYRIGAVAGVACDGGAHYGFLFSGTCGAPPATGAAAFKPARWVEGVQAKGVASAPTMGVRSEAVEVGGQVAPGGFDGGESSNKCSHGVTHGWDRLRGRQVTAGRGGMIVAAGKGEEGKSHKERGETETVGRSDRNSHDIPNASSASEQIEQKPDAIRSRHLGQG